jgi:DNA-binding NtrC family response regulator
MNSEARRVLVVEDSEAWQDIAREILEDEGFEPILERTIANGLDRINSSESFHRAIFDGHVPDGNCEPLIKAATERKPPIPVLVWSGTIDGGRAQQIAENAAEEGHSVRYFPKDPFDEETFIEALS